MRAFSRICAPAACVVVVVVVGASAGCGDVSTFPGSPGAQTTSFLSDTLELVVDLVPGDVYAFAADVVVEGDVVVVDAAVVAGDANTVYPGVDLAIDDDAPPFSSYAPLVPAEPVGVFLDDDGGRVFFSVRVSDDGFAGDLRLRVVAAIEVEDTVDRRVRVGPLEPLPE